MLRKLLEVLLIIFACVCCKHSEKGAQAQSQAQFTFQYDERELVAQPDAEEVFVEFPFVNNSKEAIDIVEYDAPCTCMGARVRRPEGKESLRFHPGEKGIVIGRLKLENFTGTITKKIWIRTSNDLKGHPSITLSAKVTIPVLIQQSQSNLFWKERGEPVPQVVMIQMNHGAFIKIQNHQLSYGSPALFSCKVEEIQEGKRYKVTVTPKNLGQRTLGILKLYTDSPIARYKIVQVYLTVGDRKPMDIADRK